MTSEEDIVQQVNEQSIEKREARRNQLVFNQLPQSLARHQPAYLQADHCYIVYQQFR